MLTDSSRPHVEAKETGSSQEEQRSNSRITRRDSATGASLTKRSRVRGWWWRITQKWWGDGREEEGCVQMRVAKWETWRWERKRGYFQGNSRLATKQTSLRPDSISQENSCSLELASVVRRVFEVNERRSNRWSGRRAWKNRAGWLDCNPSPV